MNDFLALYPEDDAPRLCTCGHPRWRHSALGPCMVIVPTQIMRTDGGPTRIERTYCPCMEWKAAQRSRGVSP